MASYCFVCSIDLHLLLKMVSPNLWACPNIGHKNLCAHYAVHPVFHFDLQNQSLNRHSKEFANFLNFQNPTEHFLSHPGQDHRRMALVNLPRIFFVFMLH